MFNLSKLSNQDLIDLLFKYDLSEKLENKLLKEVKKRLTITTFNYTKKIEEIKNINNLIKDRRYVILNYLINDNISLARKKIILDFSLTEEEKIHLLLNDSIKKELKDYIRKKDYQNYTYYSLLSEDNLPEEIFNFLLTKINHNNILLILGYYKIDNNKKNIIMKKKQKELQKAINLSSANNLLSSYLNDNLPESILNYIVKKRKISLILSLMTLTKQEIKKYFLRSYTKQAITLIYQIRKNLVINILTNLKPEEILQVLNNQTIPLELKEIIIQKNNYNYIYSLKNIDIDSIHDLIDRCSYLPSNVINDIFNYNYEKIIKKTRKTDLEYYLFKYETIPYLIEKIYNLYEYQFNQSDIQTLFNMTNIYNLDTLKFLIRKNPNFIKNILNKLLNNEKVYLEEEVMNNIIILKQVEIIEKLNDIDYQDKINLLRKTKYKELKRIILNDFKILDNQEFLLSLINVNTKEEVIFNSSLIKSFLIKNNIDINIFLQYGVGTKKYNNWSCIMIDIIKNNKLEEFIKIKDYFMNNYYQSNHRYLEINNFLDILINYSKYSDICLYLEENKIIFDDSIKNNLQFLFNSNQDKIIPKNLEELDNFKNKIYEEYALKIENDNISILELKNMVNHLFASLLHSSFISIGGEISLDSIPSITKEISDLKEELMIYASLNNILNYVEDVNSLKELIKLFMEMKDNNLVSLINEIEKIDDKIKKLYELDSKANLTTLAKARTIGGMEKQDFVLSYGGEVFDFSNKDYVLYAHVVSAYENIDDLVKGVATGKTNFISLSPISYMGQRYYYNSMGLTLAYDTIPDNSFICSSINNMSSNNYISKNSYEVEDIVRLQKGIIDTSAAIFNNSEALFYREGLKPCGIILKGGRKPNSEEIKCHQEYNLPFIITQDENKIENPQMVFHQEKTIEPSQMKLQTINDSFDLITKIIYPNRDDIYTGRRIGIFADSHALYEPTKAIIEDMKNNGVTEVYSLGDNIGLGPSPEEVLELIEKYQVKSVMGNQEYYITLGTEPFSYLTEERIRSSEWTKKQINFGINNLYFYKPSIELIVGHKRIALCHFANDVRFDFYKNSTWSYQCNYANNNAAQQFLYTNSQDYFASIIKNDRRDDKTKAGYRDAKHNLLFQGKQITYYDSIFQGHVHFEMKDKINDTNIYTLRGAGMGYNNREVNTAYYLMLKEKKSGGFDIERKLNPYDRDALIKKVENTDMPCKEKIKEYLKIK